MSSTLLTCPLTSSLPETSSGQVTSPTLVLPATDQLELRQPVLHQEQAWFRQDQVATGRGGHLHDVRVQLLGHGVGSGAIGRSHRRLAGSLPLGYLQALYHALLIEASFCTGL